MTAGVSTEGVLSTGLPDIDRSTPPGVVTAFTTDQAGREDLAHVEEQLAAVAEVQALARRIAARLSVPRPRLRHAAGSGPPGWIVSVPYRGSSDEMDLDATIEVLAGNPVPEDEDIFVRERLRDTRSVVLLVDVSGSARGERLRMVAATVGALASELAHDKLAVVAFWSDAAILSRFGDPVTPEDLVTRLLGVPARGLTNVAFPLQLARELLATEPQRGSRVLLLSDCVHNAGPDPRPVAAGLSRLDVLLDTTGEKDIDLGRDLARRGRGTLQLVHRFQEIAPAISAALRPVR